MPPAKASRKVTVDPCEQTVDHLALLEFSALSKVSHSFPMNSRYQHSQPQVTAHCFCFACISRSVMNGTIGSQQLGMQGIHRRGYPFKAYLILDRPKLAHNLPELPLLALQTLNLRVHLEKKIHLFQCKTC